MSPHAPRLRALYRSVLRELPPRPLNDPSPIKQRVRAHLTAPPSAASVEAQLQEGEQFLTYVRAQRTYAALLERYNPGMGMTEEERVRLTMRRVGMELPKEWKPDGKE